MFVRIVKLTLAEEKQNDFIRIFNEVKENIRGVNGCRLLELYRDKNNPWVFFTYSYWEHEQHLEDYRQSELFKGIWTTIKPFFAEKAEAWSVDKLATLE